jgi:hypothetical protein
LGFKKFLAAAGMKAVHTSGYHPQTNGKSERFNGILEAAIFRLNTTGNPSKWEDVLPAALFSACIHVSDSSGFSPFELLYGVKPRLPQDRRRMIAGEPAIPGLEELKSRIEALNKTRATATGNTAARALKNKEAFDRKTIFAQDLESLVVGQAVKLRNEKHTKGAPRWFGPFEVAKVLDNNAYIIIDHTGEEYPRPVNGNSLKPVALRSLIVNDMWAAPPALVQKEKRADANVARNLLKKTKALAKTRKARPAGKAGKESPTAPTPAHPPGRRLRLRLGAPPSGSGTAPAEGGDGCSRVAGLQLDRAGIPALYALHTCIVCRAPLRDPGVWLSVPHLGIYNAGEAPVLECSSVLFCFLFQLFGCLKDTI